MTLKLERGDVGRTFRTMDGNLAVIIWNKNGTFQGISSGIYRIWTDDGRNVNHHANDLVHRLSDEERDALKVAQAFKDL